MRLVVVLLAVLLLLVLAGLAAAGWVFSTRYLVPAPYALLPEFELLEVDAGVAEAGEGVVVLPPPSASQFGDTAKEGFYNLLWDGGYGRLGPVLERDAGRVVRHLELVEGRAPLAGERARLDAAVFRRDPLQDHGIAFEELSLAGPAGRLAAWWVPPAGGDAAVLMLHGRRRADRTETLRIMPTLVDAGLGVMALAYRNHDASDPAPDGFYHYGASEYEDALAGLAELRARGVRGVVLYGFSMGGAVALEAVKRWPADGPELLGVILDSPLVDMRSTIRRGAEKEDLPLVGTLTAVALQVGSWRAGVDWGRLDQREFAPELRVPVLLMAGTADDTTPIGPTDEFAARVSAPLTYWRAEGVEHVELWNQAPGEYESRVRAFLASLPGAG